MNSDTASQAFESARDTSKLTITLATGIVAFTVTFSKELGGLTPEGCWETSFLLASWIVLVLSTVVGIWTQLALTGAMDPKPKAGQSLTKPTINSKKITYPFRIQIITFLLGIIAVVVYGALKVLSSTV